MPTTKSPSILSTTNVHLSLFVLDSLMYAIVCTKPDLAQVVNVVNKFMSNPSK